ncbi:hypothetical protein [Fictibacillus barbaricus]|uniref:UPF0716 family protein affecting phage T7 exclusion n=1 Tax=Fictibacillus barbaricus TaxID=182136 RepID=A0ABU1TWX4_9BACL|nr:hypothetical protein [Fictibacillus barbaricus]MDR7071726.1 UPF0716 family protein affecting phage T7 exclusion [Fictibacillus barbaricus]
MGKFVSCLLTLIVLVGINFGLAKLISWQFIDLSVFVGLAMTLIIRYFTSTGGMSSNLVRMQAQAVTGIKVEETKSTFKPTYAYYTSLSYTIASAIAIFIYYKDYFI